MRSSDDAAGGGFGNAKPQQGRHGLTHSGWFWRRMHGGLTLEGRNRPLGDRLALELGDNALRQFRPHALGAGHKGLVFTGHGLGQLGRRQHIQHRQRRLGSHPLNSA